VLSRSPVLLTREVALSARKKTRVAPVEARVHPPRNARTAKLAVAAERVTLQRPRYTTSKLPATLVVNVIRVVEFDVPAGEAPVEWLLLTSLPIATPDEVAAVVDGYRRRWIIEEFFKALKTGCRYEERQLEDAHSLLNALATFAPIAWQLLRLRYVARQDPAPPATTVLTATQLKVLRARVNLSDQPSARDALLAVASLGGHLKSNGDPGWQVLARGYHDLLLLEAGWLARGGRRYDQ
jgi:DDE family transposase